MTDLYPYSVNSLEEMFSLRKGDIRALIKNEGVPIYSAIRDEFIGYLPTLNSAFKLMLDTTDECLSNIQTDAYEIELEESMLVIKSKTKKQPPSALLYNNLWLPKAKELLNVEDEDFYIMISNRVDVPVFCGHKNVINRLMINFTGDIKIEQTKRFVKEYA